MKANKLTPRHAAPVQRENTATVSRNDNAIAPLDLLRRGSKGNAPFAGDDAE